jgi:hypothetical protein
MQASSAVLWALKNCGYKFCGLSFGFTSGCSTAQCFPCGSLEEIHWHSSSRPTLAPTCSQCRHCSTAIMCPPAMIGRWRTAGIGSVERTSTISCFVGRSRAVQDTISTIPDRVRVVAQGGVMLCGARNIVGARGRKWHSWRLIAIVAS